MSFSNNVKTELSKTPLLNKEVLRAELAALLRVNAVVIIQNNNTKIRFSTENNPVARRIFSLIKHLYYYDASITAVKKNQLRQKTNYQITVESEKVLEKMSLDTGYNEMHFFDYKSVPYSISRDKGKIRGYLRGAFLGAGSISNPDRMYHFEIVFDDLREAEELKTMMNSVNLYGKIARRNQQFIFYYKDSEVISDVLSFMEAYQSVLKLENIRAMKDLKNNINRVINCETANIDKTVACSMRQIKAIQEIGMDRIPKNLQEIAKLRLENPNVSLKDLGELANPPLSKSSVNYKLKRIEKLVKEKTEKSV